MYALVRLALKMSIPRADRQRWAIELLGGFFLQEEEPPLGHEGVLDRKEH